jgi:anti-anti-sigma factor
MDDDVSVADEVKVHGMDWQAQESGIKQDVAQAGAGQIVDQLRHESATATARLHEQIELLEPVVALQMGQVTQNGLCVIRSRGTDLVLTGEIDLHNADEIEAHILSWHHDADNYLDCTGVDFMDSMGLTMILHVRALAVQRGACLRVICSPTVHLVLTMAGLTESLPGLTVTRGENN